MQEVEWLRVAHLFSYFFFIIERPLLILCKRTVRSCWCSQRIEQQWDNQHEISTKRKILPCWPCWKVKNLTVLQECWLNSWKSKVSKGQHCSTVKSTIFYKGVSLRDDLLLSRNLKKILQKGSFFPPKCRTLWRPEPSDRKWTLTHKFAATWKIEWRCL